MKLAWISDPHLECLAPSLVETFIRHLATQRVDAFVITGDISNAQNLDQHLALLASLQVPVYFVLGNHDFYQGSFTSVEQLVRKACCKHPTLVHLGQGEIIQLGAGTALIGHRGWADGRAGLGDKSTVRLNDYLLIEELRDKDNPGLFSILRTLGDQSADYIRTTAEEAVRNCRHLLIATHVPPFPEASMHQGRPSGPEFAPHFVNVAMGNVLFELSQRYQDRSFTVLSGHSHHSARFSPLKNLDVKVANARYGYPAISEILAV